MCVCVFCFLVFLFAHTHTHTHTSTVGSTTSKSEDPTILVSFEGSDRIDAFGVEYREIKYLPPSNLRSCKWNALSWKRASTDRAVPASGEIGSKCMYLLGTRSDETLRRGVFYQARVCVRKLVIHSLTFTYTNKHTHTYRYIM